jgi:predicted transposase YdaD
MEKTKEQEIVYQIADEIDGKVRESYSGRGMFVIMQTNVLKLQEDLGLKGQKQIIWGSP